MTTIIDVLNSYNIYLDTLGEYLDIENPKDLDIEEVTRDLNNHVKDMDPVFVEHIIEDIKEIQKAYQITEAISKVIGGIYRE